MENDNLVMTKKERAIIITMGMIVILLIATFITIFNNKGIVQKRERINSCLREGYNMSYCNKESEEAVEYWQKENDKKQERIDKAIDKLYCYGEVFDSEILQQFQKEELNILKGENNDRRNME